MILDENPETFDAKLGYCPVKCQSCGETKNSYGNSHRCPPRMAEAVQRLMDAARMWRHKFASLPLETLDRALHNASIAADDAARCESYRIKQTEEIQRLIKQNPKVARSIRKRAKKINSKKKGAKKR